jgi:hypothetical protein
MNNVKRRRQNNMGCGCKKREPVVITPVPTPIPTPQTPDELHRIEMNNYANKLSQEEIDWFNNIDTIKPLNDE